jgi:Na+-transporting NADH:ubiquinone oxidoreductase subunit A
MIRIKKGLDVPIEGAPTQKIEEARPVRRVALMGDDYVALKPSMTVQEGDSVKLGQVLFTDKRTPGVKFTSPGCGKVAAINRGAKRKFEAIIIQLEGEDEETFKSFEGSDFAALDRNQVSENLIASGLWTSLRTRPYSKVPHPDSVPHSIFITAMDTNPLAANTALIIQEREKEFTQGLQVLSHLTDGPLFVCKQPGGDIPGSGLSHVSVEEFAGPHPAGLPGTHIHFLDPVSDKKTVWSINYQDVIAIGILFLTGQLFTERVISLAGPIVKKPRLIRTRVGASIEDLVDGEIIQDNARIISGSVLSGRKAADSYAFLGRYHLQVSAIAERRERVFLGWIGAGFDRFSVKPVFASVFSGKGRKYPFTASAEGGKRALVPIGTYEKVMPLDVIPTLLLRAIIVGDTGQAQALGGLELDEEDLALCTFVCPSKYDYGPLLREVLTRIEIEG